jgi:soluble lytic murein transglycosylase-like protein
VLMFGRTINGHAPAKSLILPNSRFEALPSKPISRPKVTPPPRRVHRAAPFEAIVQKAARETGLPANLIKAVIEAESRFNPREVSPVGACGLMQLMPSTARVFKVKNIFDPEENIMAGAKHLRYLLHRFSNNIPLALAAYNAGEGPVLRYKSIPPIAETQYYVPKVLRLYKNGLS